MVWSDTLVLIDHEVVNTNFPFNTTGVLGKKFKLVLQSGEHVTQIMLNATAKLPFSTADIISQQFHPTVTVKFNGSQVASFQWNAHNPDLQWLSNEVIQNYKEGQDNIVEFDYDSDFLNAGFEFYADVYYTLDQEAPPKSTPTGDTSNTTTGSTANAFAGLFDFLKNPFGNPTNIMKTVVLAGAVIVGTIVIVKVVKGGGGSVNPIVIVQKAIRGRKK